MDYDLFGLSPEAETFLIRGVGGHGGPVVTHSPPTSEVCGSNPVPYVGKVGSCLPKTADYSAEP